HNNCNKIIIGYKRNSTSVHYYLPHHPVHRPEDPPSKIRVVFNASSQTTSGPPTRPYFIIFTISEGDILMGEKAKEWEVKMGVSRQSTNRRRDRNSGNR
ncbi:hypothetical protein, partial [Klebsiella pneumoniae]|uniref:hypothetical protein n=1 Tax=Klebsiella pneumoniae TaxID=573 RepID=UPI0040554F5A